MCERGREKRSFEMFTHHPTRPPFLTPRTLPPLTNRCQVQPHLLSVHCTSVSTLFLAQGPRSIPLVQFQSFMSEQSAALVFPTSTLSPSLSLSSFSARTLLLSQTVIHHHFICVSSNWLSSGTSASPHHTHRRTDTHLRPTISRIPLFLHLHLPFLPTQFQPLCPVSDC